MKFTVTVLGLNMCEISAGSQTCLTKQAIVKVHLLTQPASGYSSLLGNLSVCVCVCASLDKQNPHLAFKTLQTRIYGFI